MRCITALCIVALTAMAVAAGEKPMTGPEFDARTQGRTLTYGVGGTAYGVEKYLPGRQVIWAFVGEPCRRGIWYEEEPGRICFTYDHDPTPQCWNFFDEPGGLRARFLGGSLNPDLVEVDDSPGALICPGPEVGA